jgi:hypothetical protein
VPWVFRPVVVESRNGVDTVDRSVACAHESPVGDVVGDGVVGAGVGGSPEDHVNVNEPRPVENASTRKYARCVDT